MKRARVRRLPVVDFDDILVGILTVVDIARHFGTRIPVAAARLLEEIAQPTRRSRVSRCGRRVRARCRGAAAIAGLIGLGVGLEREWSGHTDGPGRAIRRSSHFSHAGPRWRRRRHSWRRSASRPLRRRWRSAAPHCRVTAYFVAASRPGAGVDGTTEAAALAVLMLATLAGIGWLTLAAGAGSMVVLALSEKTRLHGLVQPPRRPGAARRAAIHGLGRRRAATCCPRVRCSDRWRFDRARCGSSCCCSPD